VRRFTGEDYRIECVARKISKRHRNALDPLMKKWMKEVFPKVPCTVSAAVFPKSARRRCWPKGYDKAYPGGAIFITKA
jgi:hypothetical protein